MRYMEIDEVIEVVMETRGLDKDMATAFVMGLIAAHLTDGQMTEIKKTVAQMSVV